jgi:hypothetical protein
MKRILVLVALCSSSSLVLAKGYGKAGCGLGSMVVGPQGNQVIAATTNGTSNSQLFGISSGTSNCVDQNKRMALVPFIEHNKNQIQTDISKGSGESLVSLQKLMGCPSDKAQALGASFKENYGSLFSDDQLSSQDLADRLIDSTAQKLEMRVSCSIFS